MEYLTGHTIKPHQITTGGEVFFTDGTTTNLRANQPTCEAYGYTYNIASGTCSAFRYNTNLERNISNINNKFNGAGNTTGTGTNTVQINGSENTTKGFNNNCFINGSNNEIVHGVKNSTVLGVGGKSDRQGELVVGGGSNKVGGTETNRKVSVVNLSGYTTDETPTNLTVNGDGINYINVNENSIVGFEIYITRLEKDDLGSATVGNYSYTNIKGVVRVGESSGMAFIVGYTRNIGKIGVNGTKVMVDSTTGGVPSITIQVTDRAAVNNIWSATVYIHELITPNIRF